MTSHSYCVKVRKKEEGRIVEVITPKGRTMTIIYLEGSVLTVLEFEQTLSRGVAVADTTIVHKSYVTHTPP